MLTEATTDIHLKKHKGLKLGEGDMGGGLLKEKRDRQALKNRAH